ncbi:MAG: SCO family protein [Chitinophagaceae bacterium]
MKKNAALALCIAILIPSTCYLLVKYFSEDAVHMPRHYLMDTVVTQTIDGKVTTDTVWHKTKDIKLVNQLGDTVSLYQLQGKIIVANLIFTHCGTICPGLTRNMATMQASFLKGGNTRRKVDSSIVHFLSISIDPDRDSSAKLKAYADKFNANHDNWWFLTGNRDSIYRFIFEELRINKFEDHPVDSTFAHSDRFVLIDKHMKVRGYYHGLQKEDIKKLSEDIGLLMLEKEKKGRRKLPFDPSTMAIFFGMATVITILMVTYLSKKRKSEIA